MTTTEKHKERGKVVSINNDYRETSLKINNLRYSRISSANRNSPLTVDVLQDSVKQYQLVQHKNFN